VQTLDFVYSELRYDLCVHAPLYGGYLDANVVSLTVLLEFLRVPRVSEHPHECVCRIFGDRGCRIACYPIDIFPARCCLFYILHSHCVHSLLSVVPRVSVPISPPPTGIAVSNLHGRLWASVEPTH
jgi:hypothetical protein